MILISGCKKTFWLQKLCRESFHKKTIRLNSKPGGGWDAGQHPPDKIEQWAQVVEVAWVKYASSMLDNYHCVADLGGFRWSRWPG